MLPPTADSLALDAAAGSGLLTWRFRHRNIVSADMRVTACRAIKTHTPDARAAAADVDSLPFRSGTFAQIYFLEVIEHLTMDSGERALRELRRVARPGARCLITTPNYHSYWVVLEWLIDRLRLTPRLGGAQHVSHYDRRMLGEAARSAGWTTLRLGSFNHLAPLVSILSARVGARVTAWEAGRDTSIGPLLYCLCEAS
jgi:ubiquinone/menaquinone biosynthesis C-methylase UbiE